MENWIKDTQDLSVLSLTAFDFTMISIKILSTNKRKDRVHFP